MTINIFIAIPITILFSFPTEVAPSSITTITNHMSACIIFHSAKIAARAKHFWASIHHWVKPLLQFFIFPAVEMRFPTILYHIHLVFRKFVVIFNLRQLFFANTAAWLWAGIFLTIKKVHRVRFRWNDVVFAERTTLNDIILWNFLDGWIKQVNL